MHAHTTPFDNYSTSALADLIGGTDAEIKALELRLKAAKAELTKRGLDRAEGECFTVTKSEAVRWTLNTAAIREAMGAAWCDAHSKVTAVVSFRVTPIRAALALAA